MGEFRRLRVDRTQSLAGVAVAEIGTDHQMYVVKLARDQSAVVAPLG
jgi:hypothetical protein